MITALALKALVVAMMLAAGLELSPRDLRDGVADRALFVGALVANCVLFPLAAYALGVALGFAPAFLAGIVLAAAAPGGASGPLFTRMGGGHLGFATALVVAVSVIGLVSAPVAVTSLLGGEGDGLFWPMLWMLAVYQIAPLGVGMVVRYWRQPLADRLAPPTALTANVLLVGIIVALVIAKGALLFTIPVWTHIALILALLVWMLPGWVWPTSTVRAAGLVTAVRNLSVALLLSSSFFEDPQTDIAVLAWGLWIMVVPAGVALVWGRGPAVSDPGAGR